MIKCTKSDSKNRKLGDNVRATYRKVGDGKGGTCPKECHWMDNGCYAQRDFTRIQSEQAPYSQNDADEVLEYLMNLPGGKKVRHLVAGDICRGNRIDWNFVDALIKGHDERDDIIGWLYTHTWRRDSIEPEDLNKANGLCGNASCDNLEQAKKAHKKGWPTTVVVPHDTEKNEITIEYEDKEVPVVLCPEQTDDIPCSECQLCMQSDREAIVGFLKH